MRSLVPGHLPLIVGHEVPCGDDADRSAFRGLVPGEALGAAELENPVHATTAGRIFET
jgi:hypothetical protein